MRVFERENYYQILKIPLTADLNTIKKAYREALDTYREDALATYSLFPEEQRAELLQTIETAFHTLIDTHQRTAYDQMLLDSGRINAADYPPQAQRMQPSSGKIPGSGDPRNLRDRVKKKYENDDIRRLADQVGGKDLVSGMDLKRLREALGIDISEIFESTRISKTTLTNIETNDFGNLPAEVFLKAFLKSYAEILQIDPQRVIQGYLKHLSLSRR
jgi:DnaJ-class molecular chaperone